MKLIFSVIVALFIISYPNLVHPESKYSKSNAVVKKHHQISRNSAVKIFTKTGHGSGSYIKLYKKSYIITAKHVVKNSLIVAVKAGKEVVVGEVVFKLKKQDIALIKIPKLKFKNPVELIDLASNSLKISEEIVYSGYPSFYNMLTTGGQIAGERKGNIILQGLAWPGSSGSGAIGKKGKIVGVITAIGKGKKQLIETIVWMEPIRKNFWKEVNGFLKPSH
jgi:V8-like Glu-specific endopeptidase